MMQGMPVGDGKAPTLQKLTVYPDCRVMEQKAQQQIAVQAHYSDGQVRDVTRLAQYQSNEGGVAAVDGEGLVPAALAVVCLPALWAVDRGLVPAEQAS